MLPDSAPAFGVDAPAYVAIRAVMYLAALLIIGCCAFILLIATRVSHLSGSYLEVSAVVPSTRRLARCATVVLAFAMVGRLLAQGFMIGEGETMIIWPLLETTLWGWGWLVGGAATLVIAGGLLFTRGTRAAWRVTAVGTMALALSFSLTGHAISTPRPMLHVTLDAIHVMAAGGWLGTLTVVATIGLYTALMLPIERRAHAATELIGAFSSFALLCATTLAVTGVVQAWAHLPTVSALWQTHYGQALFRKLVVIAMTALVGAFNWLVVKPRLAKPNTISLLRKSAAVELTIGVVVVVLTAILVGTSPPDADDAMPSMQSNAAPTASAAISMRG
ncbi:MAG: CopD family protein [Gemmatimonadota bacterium]|nr:CopD family protein [Gemmatimonadota bacterium]